MSDLCRKRILLGLAAVLAPTAAWAEPRPSGAVYPLLWLGLIVAALVLGAVVGRLLRRWIGTRRHAWMFWLIAFVLAVLVVVLLGPLVIAFGGIFLTGRTM
jgi:hypothetical protein